VARRVAKPFRESPTLLAPTLSVEEPAPAPTATPVPTAPAGWSAELRRARWLDGTRFEIGGWAYLRTNPGLSALDATIRVYLQDAAGSRRLATASRLVSAEVNALSTDAAHDWSTAAFEAVIDVAPLLERLHRGTVTQNWTVWIELGDGAHEIAGRFLRRHAWGSAGELSAEAFGDDRHVRPVWTDEAGLGFDVARRNVVADELILTGRTLSGTLHRNGAFDATGVMLEDAKTKKQTTAALTGDAASSTFSISVPRSNALSSRSTLSYLYVIDAAGVRRHVHWAATRGLESSERPTDGLLVRHGASGVIRIEEHMAGVLVDDVEFVGGDDPVVRISGGWRGAPSGVRAELRGPRQTVPARSTTVADGRFTAIIPLLVEDAWGNTGVAPYNGSYRVWAVLDDDTQAQARVSQLFVETLPHKVFDALVNLRVERTPQNCFSLDIRGPLPEEETGPFNFGRMARRYTAQVTEPRPVDLADAVYYESFGGRTANDNTLAIHDELLRRRPDLTRYWAVDSRSVPIPEGAIPIMFRGAKWLDVLATSRFVVTNYWLPGAFVRRPGQVVLQAWHGTPLKLLGNDRPTHEQQPGYRSKTLRDVSQWSFLISQNEHSTQTFRQAYGYTGEVLEVGYPRDDALVGECGAEQAIAARRRLGLSPTEKVILYAPTFRDGVGKMVRYLDHEAVVTAMGPGTTVLIRGHANTIKHGGDLAGKGILDVTTYPEITDLYLAADVCITDYSSVMFDFSITGKPILFFVPDLDEYRETLRGMYFDLGEISPGPMLETNEEVVQALSLLPQVTAEYADRYAAWQARFNAWDDGHAAGRVVDALLAEADKLPVPAESSVPTEDSTEADDLS
jgi:CDP-glycerol glycerophosphotransferase (TagB/SpsB family)